MLEVRAWGARAADDAAMTGGIKLHSGARETNRKRTGHERLKSPVVETLHITGALFAPCRAAEQNRRELRGHDLGADWRYLKSAARRHPMEDASHFEPIPRPPGHMLVGNLFDVDRAHPMEGFAELARKYGPIYKLEVPGLGSRIIASSFELVDPLCDESRFDKNVGAGLGALASGPAGRGLFTAETQDPNWRKAHNVLLPSFSMDAMRGYHPRMLDIATQLMLKWERLNADDTVDVPADMTRLTLDTIALCGFDYRFNSFYRDTPHPFVLAMLNTLEAAQAVARELPIQAKLKPGRAKKVAADQKFMVETVRHIIEERRKSGVLGEVNDLLDRMLTGVDRQSGEKLDETNIIAQCITFLIAGHETTSGLLSFALYELIRKPKFLERAYEEVDRVLGAEVNALPTYAQIHQLPYVSQILEETLRLWPTAPAFTRRPYKDTVLGGRYKVEANSAVVVLTGMLHRDPKIWGDNPEAFDPDRFSSENRAKIPPNAYKPFGTGQRACIGRQFALQEATLVLAMLLQRFEFLDFANYQLETKQTLTIKPANFNIRVKRRRGRLTTGFFAAPQLGAAPTAAPPANTLTHASTAVPNPAAAADTHATPLLVLFGSNLGTAEGIAHRIADDARSRGFAATVGPLDEHADALPREGAVVIVTASYNGQPPDNAVKFCQKLRDPALPADAFAGVEYSVFGCGNRDWSATYQAIPTLVDAELEKHGGKRIYTRGEGDARGDFDRDYRGWYGELFSSLAEALDLPAATAEAKMATPRISVSFVNRLATSPIMRSYSAVAMTVRMNRELQRRDCERPSERSTRHIEIALPSGVSYSAGDHLGIVPRNGLETIKRVLIRFKLDPSLYATIVPRANADTHLPGNEPVPLLGILANRIELREVATREQIATLAQHVKDETERKALEALAGDDARYGKQVFAVRKSVLDILDEHPSCAPPFEVFLDMMPALRPRYYSISSSPLVGSGVCSITVAVLEGPALSGRGEFRGVCSNYLAAQPADATVYAFIRKPTISFHPPENPHLPMIMIGPGTGVAPFRGFLLERAALKKQGAPIGESLLFFGCRDPTQDYLYEDEMRAFEAGGVTKLVCAFSREPGKPKTYVQQAIAMNGDAVWELLQKEALVFVCGEASRMAPDVRQAFVDLFRKHTGASAVDGKAWLAGLVTSHRYLEDIWASSVPVSMPS
jgi:cytochrome P450 / NADPH-cytochrome P450 reductase